MYCILTIYNAHQGATSHVSWTVFFVLTLEEAHDGSMTLLTGNRERSGVIISSLVHIGPALQQGLHDRYMTLPAGNVQRSDVNITSLVHIGPGLQKSQNGR